MNHPSRRRSRMPVLEVRRLGGDWVLLALRRPEGDPGGFRAGQFAQLQIPGHSLPRPLSILASTPDRLDFLVKVVGPGTSWLAGRAPGDLVAVVEPLGHGWLDGLPNAPDEAEEWILVGGGVGIAPLLALAVQHPAHPRRILFGFRDQAALAAARPLWDGIEVEVATEDGSAGFAGRVDSLLANLLNEAESATRRVFCCGPEPMMEAVARRAEAAGVPCRLSLETLMGCGIGICVGCAVPAAQGGFQLACQAGPVFDSRELRSGGLA